MERENGPSFSSFFGGVIHVSARGAPASPEHKGCSERQGFEGRRLLGFGVVGVSEKIATNGQTTERHKELEYVVWVLDGYYPPPFVFP